MTTRKLGPTLFASTVRNPPLCRPLNKLLRRSKCLGGQQKEREAERKRERGVQGLATFLPCEKKKKGSEGARARAEPFPQNGGRGCADARASGTAPIVLTPSKAKPTGRERAREIALDGRQKGSKPVRRDRLALALLARRVSARRRGETRLRGALLL